MKTLTKSNKLKWVLGIIALLVLLPIILPMPMRCTIYIPPPFAPGAIPTASDGGPLPGWVPPQDPHLKSSEECYSFFHKEYGDTALGPIRYHWMYLPFTWDVYLTSFIQHNYSTTILHA